MNKNRMIKIFAALLSMNLVFARGKKPYYIAGNVSLSYSGEYSIAGLNLELYNRSNKGIESFTAVFRLCDEDGLPPFDEDIITMDIEQYIPPYESIETCISLDDLIDEAPDDPYEVEMLFIKSITYDDGSVWQD